MGKSISQLNNSGALTGAELIEIVQSGASVKTTLDDLPVSVATAAAIASDVATINGNLALKRNIIPRSVGIASDANPTPNADTTDLFYVSLLAADAVINTPSGTPHDGQLLTIRITSDATPRLLSFDPIYLFPSSITAPTTTVANETVYLDFIYNSLSSKWECMNVLGGF